MRTRVIEANSPIVFLATRPAPRLPGSATLRDVAREMTGRLVSAVLVGDEPGIVTEADLVRGLALSQGPDDPVSPLVSRALQCVAPQTSVVDAAAMMLNDGLRHVVVDLGEERYAIVSLREVMAAFVQAIEPRLWLRTLRIALLRNDGRSGQPVFRPRAEGT